MALIAMLETAGQYIGLFFVLAILAEFLDGREHSRRS